MQNDNIIISNNIKKFRALKGYKQQEIADKMGITIKTYNIIENNPVKYSIIELKKVADALECNVYDFFII